MRLGRIQNDFSAAGFDLVKAQGLEFVEFCCNYEEHVHRLIDAKESIKKEIARTGIDVSSVGRWNNNIQENGVIVPERLSLYLELMETAIELGAKVFVVGCNRDKSISLYRNYENAVSFFRTLIERADGRIKVAVEHCDWNNFITSPKQWEIVLDELPELYLKYDASAHCYRGEDYLAPLSDWAHRVAHVHIKGVVRAGKNAVDDPPAGMDDINWPAIFAILYSRGYNGDLSIEPHSKTWSGELGNAGVLFTRDYIRKFML